MDAMLQEVTNQALAIQPFLEGNMYTLHKSNQKSELLNEKASNLFHVCKMLPLQAIVVEIGFNAGHSATIMCSALQQCKEFHAFDICTHAYVKPLFESFSVRFPLQTSVLHEGDSRSTLQEFVTTHESTIDLVHVDGGHAAHIARQDILHAKKLLKQGGVILVDDTNLAEVNTQVHELLHKDAAYKELSLLHSTHGKAYAHRAFYKL